MSTIFLVMDFLSIDYLRTGSSIQQSAYQALVRHKIIEKLKPYQPLLVGTIPINLDIAGSDLDIICCNDHLSAFQNIVTDLFGHFPSYRTTINVGIHACVVASFELDDFPVEVFCQDIPTQQQLGYRHMMIEYQLLQKYGTPLREQVIALKKAGLKTEPAFAEALELTGNPYEALLAFEGS